MENIVRAHTLTRFAAGVLLALSATAQANTNHSDTLFDHAEAKLNHGIELLQQGRLDDALGTLDELLSAQPTFQLGHAVRADMLAQLAGQNSLLANDESLAALRHEATKRYSTSDDITSASELVPSNLLEPNTRADSVVIVDLTANRLYQYTLRDGEWQQVGDHYVTIGKAGAGKRREGDNRTPIGLYRVQPFLPDESLPELYGYGALPLDYPNTWDRHMRRTGSGIWIHGQPRDSYARPPLDSEGCVVISNRVLPGLRDDTQTGETAVILVRSIDWVERSTLESMRNDLAASLEAWRASWVESDMDKFMMLHAADFRNDRYDRARFEARKRALANRQSSREITITDREMLLFDDIDGKTLAEVRFTQHYDSKRYQETSQKIQYWSLANGSWQLELESESSRPRNRSKTTVAAADRADEIVVSNEAYPQAR